MYRVEPYSSPCCSYMIAAEQKARATYENLIHLTDDHEIKEILKFLRQREVVHYQRFGEALVNVQEHLLCKH